MVVAYIFSQFFERIAIFLRRWYVIFSRRFWAHAVDQFLIMERSLALRVMVRTWTKPLYGDYTIIGKIIGPIFRTWRIVFALVVYASYFIFMFVLWLSWLAFPVFVLYKAFT